MAWTRLAKRDRAHSAREYSACSSALEMVCRPCSVWSEAPAVRRNARIARARGCSFFSPKARSKVAPTNRTLTGRCEDAASCCSGWQYQRWTAREWSTGPSASAQKWANRREPFG